MVNRNVFTIVLMNFDDWLSVVKIAMEGRGGETENDCCHLGNRMKGRSADACSKFEPHPALSIYINSTIYYSFQCK